MQFLLFSCLLIFPSLITAADYIYHICSDNSNFTTDSPFETNINQLLHSLQTNGPLTGFYNITTGRSSDKAYGLVLCRGDVSASDCASCLNASTTQIRQLCPNEKEGIIWYDYCLLRYSNQSFFSTLNLGTWVYLSNTRNVSVPVPDRFNQLSEELMNTILGELMNNLATQAAFNQSKLMFAGGETGFVASKKIYSSMQCTRDLSRNDCYTCLQGSIGQIPSCCIGKEGGQILSGSCNISQGAVVAYYHRQSSLKSILNIEIEAVLAGLRLANEIGMDSVWIEMDAKVAVECIQRKIRAPWIVRQNISKIHHELSILKAWEIFHSWRESNRVADHLAKVGLMAT